MSIYDGPATIRQDRTEALVHCGFTVRSPGQRPGTWFGRFTEASVRLVAAEADLTLPDGAIGRILIDRLNPTGRSGTFMGTGPPPSTSSGPP